MCRDGPPDRLAAIALVAALPIWRFLPESGSTAIVFPDIKPVTSSGQVERLPVQDGAMAAGGRWRHRPILN